MPVFFDLAIIGGVACLYRDHNRLGFIAWIAVSHTAKCKVQQKHLCRRTSNFAFTWSSQPSNVKPVWALTESSTCWWPNFQWDIMEICGAGLVLLVSSGILGVTSWLMLNEFSTVVFVLAMGKWGEGSADNSKWTQWQPISEGNASKCLSIQIKSCIKNEGSG